MEEEKPIFIADENKNSHFVRAKIIIMNNTKYLTPNYLEKTEGHIISGQYLDTMDALYSFPESNFYIRVLMELYDNGTEEMLGYTWVYIAHPDVIKRYNKRGVEEDD